MRAALIATMRNEGPYIIEWIAWHRLVGFTEFVICTNDCVDGSPALLDRLAARGLVAHIPCTPGPDDRPQLYAYQQAEPVVRALGPDWAMVLDADEFLNIHVGHGTLPDLIAAAPDATAFLINWRIFGSGGNEIWSDEPITRRFTRCAPRDQGVNLSFKTLFRCLDAYHCPLLPHGPGFAKEEHLPTLRPVDGAGRPLPELYARSEEFLQTEPGRIVWDLAQINHYNTRAWEDYLVKHHRTGGLHRWERDPNWAAFDRNEEEDRSIQRRWPALEAELAWLRADPETAALEEHCRALYGAHVARLRQVAA